jgi:hypothetical protein
MNSPCRCSAIIARLYEVQQVHSSNCLIVRSYERLLQVQYGNSAMSFCAVWLTPRFYGLLQVICGNSATLRTPLAGAVDFMSFFCRYSEVAPQLFERLLKVQCGNSAIVSVPPASAVDSIRFCKCSAVVWPSPASALGCIELLQMQSIIWASLQVRCL